jgi:cytochrome c553
MGRDQGPFKLDNPWPRIGWWSTVGLLAVGAVLGFLVLGRDQQNGPTLGTWSAICRALGISADTTPAGEAQPPSRTPSRIAWTGATLAEIAAGNAEHGAFVGTNCTACHGEQGVSQSALFPTLAGMPAATIYKQLDDFRAGKRSSGVMNAIAQALTPTASADVAAYFSSRTDGLVSVVASRFQAGHTLRQENPATRLAFAGDPARGIPPCAACHGPAGTAPGAPSLEGQQSAYIQRQLVAFAQDMRQNDINEQMRTVASRLTLDEMRVIAEFYGAPAIARTAGR